MSNEILNNDLENENNIEKDFYSIVLKSLKEEAKGLCFSLFVLRKNKHDYNSYISALKSLKEILNLISIYEYKPMYSEYGAKDENDNLVTEISVWEQNHDNQIRNHKVWRTNIPYKNK